MSFDLFAAVTKRIIDQLEAGTIPWHKPWSGGSDCAMSHVTGKPYSLLNHMLLGGRTGEYLTFKQCTDEGGTVKKGEKASMIVFWKILEEIDQETGEIIKTPFLRYYKVFHIDQCEGITPRFDKAHDPGALGWGPGVMVGLHDIGKGALSALIAMLLFPQYAGIAVVAGSACVIGHIFPVFMKFKGGKGFAAYIGMWLVVDWRVALLVLAAVVFVTVVFDYLTIGTTITVLALPIYLSIVFIGWIPLIAASVATITVIVRHIENYIRIYQRKEFGLRTALRKEQRVS